MTTLTEATRITQWILKHYKDKPWLTHVGIETHPEDGHHVVIGVDRKLISDKDLVTDVIMTGVPVYFRHQERKTEP